MADKENKPWWLSKGFWGGALTVIFVGIKAAGLQIDLDETTMDILRDNILLIATGLSGILAIIGRLLAKKKLTK